MNYKISKSRLSGTVNVPASKSHTVRAVAFASLASGESIIRSPLESDDARSAVRAYRALGAAIEIEDEVWRVTGFAGNPIAPEEPIDVGNSGTTMRIAMGSCALIDGAAATLTGDGQVRGRPVGALAQSLTDLGARIDFLEGAGTPPIAIRGRLKGGETSIEAVTSQFLTSLLINAPLAEGDSTIKVPLLNERPYVGMTLEWLDRLGIEYTTDDQWTRFEIPGNQSYPAFDRRVPGDFSSATFFLCAGALGDNAVTCDGLDMSDTQGDRAVVDYLRDMGARVTVGDESIRVEAKELRGCEIDLNDTPDALPMMAVVGCFARGETRLVNVPQARLKETDRIAVMREELTKLGAQIEELEDGLVVRESTLSPATVEGHGDHRVVMALSIAATQIEGDTIVRGAGAVDVTYPNFVEALRGIQGNVEEH